MEVGRVEMRPLTFHKNLTGKVPLAPNGALGWRPSPRRGVRSLSTPPRRCSVTNCMRVPSPSTYMESVGSGRDPSPFSGVTLPEIWSTPVPENREVVRSADTDQVVRLSVVMPVLNEERTLRLALNRLLHTHFPCPVEVIVVDDGSTDLTWDVLTTFTNDGMVLCRHETNRGKGAAVLTGISVASGTHVIIFDADLEYDPEDIPRLVQPVIEGRASTVYGARLFGRDTVYQSFWFALGNRFTTLATNVLYDAAITDLHTCLKLLPLPLLRSLCLDESGFGLDTQLTARMLLSGVRPYEVPISYNSRTREEGKKIGWRHGVESLAILRRERVAARRRPIWMKASRDLAQFHRVADVERLIARAEALIASGSFSSLSASLPEGAGIVPVVRLPTPRPGLTKTAGSRQPHAAR